MKQRMEITMRVNHEDHGFNPADLIVLSKDDNKYKRATIYNDVSEMIQVMSVMDKDNFWFYVSNKE